MKTQWNINCTPTLKTSANSSVSYSNRITNNTLGIKQNTIEELLNIYPNPTNGILNFEAKGNNVINGTYELTVTNTLGQKVYSATGDVFNVTKVDLGECSNGIYFVRFTNNKKVYTGKIIISK